MSTTTLATRVRDNAAAHPGDVALRRKSRGVWQPTTWAQYWDQIQDVAHALIALGIEAQDRVAIHSENRPEWLICDIATVAVRGVSVGVYPTNPAAEVGYLLENSQVKLLVAEDQEQVDKALAVSGQCPDLTHIVYLEPRGIRGHYGDERLIYWDDFLALGREHREKDDGAVKRRMEQAQPDDLITLVYTSGSTGPPKGAMLTTSNVEFAIDTVMTRGGTSDPPPGPSDYVLTYLPLSHVAERFFTTWMSCASRLQVTFAESIDTVPQNLQEVQPTLVMGVPRIWEKLLASAQIRLEDATWLKRKWSGFWLARAERIGDALVSNGGRHTPASRTWYVLGWICMYRALRVRTGLRYARYAVSGAAPIAPEVLKFFMGIGVPMHELYGMTENSAIATTNKPGRVKLGTVGEPHEGTELKIDETTGEILVRSPAVFAGYWRNPEKTAETIDAEGWLHTGDVGEWVDGTHVTITDRMKDIIITAGGKNVSPSEVENALKVSPYIKEALVIGDGRRFLTALIGIELDTVGDWATRKRIAYTTYRDLTEKPEVRELVQGVVDTANERFNAVEQVKAFALLPKELDHDEGELTATQKVKRSAVTGMFADLVDELYEGAR